MDVTNHRLFQLRIYFVCDGDDVPQHVTEIHSHQIVL